MLQLSGETVTNIYLVFQTEHPSIFQVSAHIQLMNQQGTDHSHFYLCENFAVVNSTAEICVNPIHKQLLFLNIPVRVSLFEISPVLRVNRSGGDTGRLCTAIKRL